MSINTIKNLNFLLNILDQSNSDSAKHEYILSEIEEIQLNLQQIVTKIDELADEVKDVNNEDEFEEKLTEKNDQQTKQEGFFRMFIPYMLLYQLYE